MEVFKDRLPAGDMQQYFKLPRRDTVPERVMDVAGLDTTTIEEAALRRRASDGGHRAFQVKRLPVKDPRKMTQ